jgi:hypothetical protein
MYYVHADNETPACCRIIRRLNDFARTRPDEGSRWVVYQGKSQYLRATGAIYEFTEGKLRKTPDLRMSWSF